MSDFSHKTRDLYLTLAENLFKLQQTYHQASTHLNVVINGFVLRSDKDLEDLDRMEEQSKACLSAIEKLESIKLVTSLAVVSDGTLSTVDDLFKAIVLLEKFLLAIDDEKETVQLQEKYFVDFLNLKQSQLCEVKDVLEKLLEYKLENKHKLGKEQKH